MALLNTLGYFDAFDALLRQTAEWGFMSESVLDLYALSRTPAEALRHVTAHADTECAASPLSSYSR